MQPRVTPFALAPLARSLTTRAGVGPATAAALAKRSLATLGDALFFFPRAYQDRRRVTPLDQLAPGMHAVVRGRITASGRFGRGGRGYRLVLGGPGPSIACLWFRYKRAHLEGYTKGREVLAVGDVDQDPRGGLQMVHPSLFDPKDLEQGHPALGRLVPVYPEIEGVPQGRLRRVMAELTAELAPQVEDPLFGRLPDGLYPMASGDALLAAHLPGPDTPASELDPAAAAWRRALAVNELFYFELALALKRNRREVATARPLAGPGELVSRFLRALPFKLTPGQVQAVEQLRQDLARPKPMGRLLMGDVSTGKTVVALAAALMAAEAGAQAAFMAPTEILARQHLATAQRFLEPLGLEAVLVTGADNGGQRRAALEAAARGAALVVGTHALFSQAVEFKSLGLAIIDEQHRFGVHQRLRLAAKGGHPHLLVLSATPIPRTLALALAGHLDISDLPQRVGGSPRVATRLLEYGQRKQAVEAIGRALARGEQVFVICPLVEASDQVAAPDAVQTHRRLSAFFQDVEVGLVHGRMDGEAQQCALDDFAAGRTPLLVATTVVEVGVDVDRATLMVVLGAERFGLSQLHQLRGRVGRGDRPGACILVAGPEPGESGLKRLQVLTATDSGRQVAEADLGLRGPGEALGRRQSGLPPFRVADWLVDARFVPAIREQIAAWLEQDPEMASEELAPLKAEALRRWGARLGLEPVD